MESKVNKILSAFSFGKVQDFLTFLKEMERNNLSVSDIEEFVVSKRKEIIRKNNLNDAYSRAYHKLWKEVARKCPSCRNIMKLMDAGDGGCHWFCQKCGMGVYSENSVKEEIEAIGFGEEVHARIRASLNRRN
jgi:hypothetical protein